MLPKKNTSERKTIVLAHRSFYCDGYVVAVVAFGVCVANFLIVIV